MKIIEDIICGRIEVGLSPSGSLPSDVCGEQRAAFVSSCTAWETKVDITDAASYWAASTEPSWNMQSFPSCAPPWDRFTFFWREPEVFKTASGMIRPSRRFRTEAAAYVEALDAEDAPWHGEHDRSFKERAKWVLQIHLSTKDGSRFAPVTLWPVIAYVAVCGDGTPLVLWFIPTVPNDSVLTTEVTSRMHSGALCPLLTGLCFANCKNVIQSEQVIEKRGAKFKKRDRCPRITYKTLEINGQKKAMADALEESGGSVQKALHICRGHFATYTEEAPLFGKHTGTFWVPMHTRGKRVNGRVIKDYRIKQ